MNLKVKEIIDALKSVECGSIVYQALNCIPNENLQDMHDMIVDILESRKNNARI